MSETRFLKLPLEVVFEIFKHLDGSDFLTLRKVCLKTKKMVDSFKKGDWTDYHVFLEDAEDYKKYVTGSLQIPNIYIARYPASSDPSPSYLTKFLNDYAPKIKKLQIGNYFGCQTEDEFDFFSAFANLKELQIDILKLNALDQPTRIPLNFKTLKVLNIISRWELNLNEVECIKEMLNFCSQTMILRFPFQNFMEADQIYQFLMEVVDHPERQALNGVKIKWIDMGGIIKSTTHQDPFFNFLKFCFDRGVKLMNLYSSLMAGYEGVMGGNQGEEYVNKTIFSLLGICNICRVEFLNFGWDNLESLKVDSNDFVELINEDNHEWRELVPSPPALPNLNTLSILFNSRPWKSEGFKELNFCLDLLFPKKGAFGSIRRTGLTELNLNFCQWWDKRKSLILANMVDAWRILWSAPNLKRLKIGNWSTNQWKVLFKGLPELEELSVKDCDTFTDWEVIGDSSNPDFHQLKGLKKLTLLLDEMRELTDKAFKEVFSKMSLVELELFGEYDCSPSIVTLEGIRALLDGPFAASVRKLTLEGLNFDDEDEDASSEDLESIKRLFPFFK